MRADQKSSEERYYACLDYVVFKMRVILGRELL